MSDRGRFSGFSWHMEYHTTDRKKEKAANCIYLTNNRICECKKSVYYLEKCFDSTHCPHRVKEENPKTKTESKTTVSAPAKSNTTSQNQPKPKRHCSLPWGTKVNSKNWGDGTLNSFDSKTGKITISFNGKIIPFLYPDAFAQKHLTVDSEELLAKIENDIKRMAKR